MDRATQPLAGVSARRGGYLDSISAALPAVMVFLAVLAIPLSAAPGLHLSTTQLSSWIFALYAGPGLLGVLLAWRHAQPLVLTGNVFAIILFASEAGRQTFPELAGAAAIAGAVVAVLGVTGLSARLARLVPPSIVLGLVAGAVLPFVVRTFAALGEDPLVVGSAIGGYVLGRRFLPSITPLLPAVVVGMAAAEASGNLGPMPGFAPPMLNLTAPVLTLPSVVTVTPILVAIQLLQANIPSLVFLQSQGYKPPEREIDVVSGLGSAGLSLLGPTAVSLPLPVIPLVAGPECGARERRLRAALMAGAALVLIGLFAGVAVGLVRFLPASLIQALAGLALLGVLAAAFRQVAAGPLILGPLLAFAIVQSGLTLLGLGPFFWALVIALVVSRVLEGEALRPALDRPSQPAGTPPQQAPPA